MASTQNTFKGTAPAFRVNKTRGIESSIDVSSKRKDSLEKKAIDDKHNQEQAKTKEVSRREKERKQMYNKLSVEETNPNRNTNIRRKEVVVGRPDTAKDPMDPRSKLLKQSEYKIKRIDEKQEKSMSLQKYHNLPDALVSAVTAVLEKSMNPFAKKDDDKKSSKKDDDKDMMNDDDDDQDNDQDKQIGSSKKKTKVDVNPKTKDTDDGMKEELKGKQHKLDKNKNGRLDAHDFKLLRKEEVSLSDEETSRILAKLNEADDEDKHDGPEHIVMQLRKAKSLGANNRPIHFHDGSKVKVSAAHVQKALDMHGSFKKAPDKDEFTQKLQASHTSFKKAIGEEFEEAENFNQLDELSKKTLGSYRAKAKHWMKTNYPKMSGEKSATGHPKDIRGHNQPKPYPTPHDLAGLSTHDKNIARDKNQADARRMSNKRQAGIKKVDKKIGPSVDTHAIHAKKKAEADFRAGRVHHGEPSGHTTRGGWHGGSYFPADGGHPVSPSKGGGWHRDGEWWKDSQGRWQRDYP